jgi:hypothetical protein
MKKVFVVVEFYEYEGYSEPLGVFSTNRKAEAYIKKVKKEYPNFDGEIFEKKLDDFGYCPHF